MRMQRLGRSNYAFYNIVVAQARHRRNGKVHAIVGTYNPHPTDERYKHVNLDFNMCKEWLVAGAEPTGMVAKLLAKAGLLPSPPRIHEVMQHAAKERDIAAQRPE